MEERIARLESDVGHIRSDISEMKTDLREMRGGISALTLAIAKVDHGSKIGLAANVVAHLLIAGSVLAFMARALKWI